MQKIIVCNFFFLILLILVVSKNQGIYELMELCEKSKKRLKFHTAIFEYEELTFQVSDEFGAACLRCVYVILRDKSYQRKDHQRNLLNNNCEKTEKKNLYLQLGLFRSVFMK